MISMLKKKLRHREFKTLIKDHTACEWLSWDLRLGSLVPESTVLYPQ